MCTAGNGTSSVSRSKAVPIFKITTRTRKWRPDMQSGPARLKAAGQSGRDPQTAA
ncbi:hypothetical protein QF047_000191 [Arthrobacter sp. W4I7]|nr:hypothetical protein [Arthrobacter sp. W4I7]